MEITAAYLSGFLKEDIYIVQLEGSQERGKEHLVCHLKRSLYSLTQSGRQWRDCFDTFMKHYPLLHSKCDMCALPSKQNNICWYLHRQHANCQGSRGNNCI